MKGNGKCLNFCVKSVWEWKIEGCLSMLKTPWGNVIGRGGGGWPDVKCGGSPHSYILYVSVNIRVERARREGWHGEEGCGMRARGGGGGDEERE
jgi:hypothetical protein